MPVNSAKSSVFLEVLSILTIDCPAFITNRTDTSVNPSSASVGAQFEQFLFQDVNNGYSRAISEGNGLSQHLTRYLAESAPDFVQPRQVFRLHKHGTEAGDSPLLIRPGAGGKKAAGKLGQSQMKILAGRSFEDLLR